MLKYFWRHKRDDKGFTLIELLIVVAIIAILAAILIPNFLRARAQSMVSAAKGNLKNLATALESYFVDNNEYPATLGALSTGQLYLRAIPIDPCTRDSYDAAGAAAYTVGSSPITDYTMSVNFASTRCAGIVSGDMLYYTPGGGLTP